MSMQGFGGWSADQINNSMGMGPGGAGSFNQGVFDAAIGGMNPAYTPYVGGYPSFGALAAPGTYSPGNAGGLSSFSGQPLPGGSKTGYVGSKGADSGIAAWGSQPITPPAAPAYTPPPAPQGGGGWDTSDQWGRPYVPPAAPAPAPSPSPWPGWIDAANNQGSPQGGYDPEDPSTWGAIGWSPEAIGGSKGGLSKAGGGWSTFDQFGRPYAPPAAPGGGSSSYPVTPPPQNYPTPGADMWGGRVNLPQPNAQRDNIARQMMPAFNPYFGVGGLVPSNGYDPAGERGTGYIDATGDAYGNRFFQPYETFGQMQGGG